MFHDLNLLWVFIFQMGILPCLPAQDTSTAHQYWVQGVEGYERGLFKPAAQSFNKAADLFGFDFPFRSKQSTIWQLHCQSESADVSAEIDDLIDQYEVVDGGFSKSQTAEILGHLWMLKADYLTGDTSKQRCLEQAENLVKPYLDDLYSLGAMIFLRTGSHYYENEAHDSAVFYFEKALSLITNRGQVLTEGLIYLRWAQALRRIGDLHKAENLIQSGLQVFRKNYGEEHPEVATAYNNLAIVQKAMGNEEAADISYQRALRIREILYGRESNEYAIVLNNAALQFLDDGQITVAERYAKQTIDIFEQLDAPNGRFHVASYNTLAKVYTRLNDHDRAYPLYKKAVDLHHAYFPQNPRIRFYYIDLGRNAQARGNVKDALVYFHKAMCASIDGIDENDINDDPNEDHLANYQTLKHLCLMKANAWMNSYTQSSDTSNLFSAIKLYNLADHFATKNRTEVTFQKSKILFSRQNLPVYEGAIKANIELAERTGDAKYYAEAFLKNEKSKSLTLLESLLEASALKNSAIDLEVLAQEAHLQDSIALIRKELLEKSGPGRDELILKKTKLELAYEHFKESLERRYPKYHQAKYDFEFINLQDLGRLCSADETLLEYFLGEENIYLFLISNDGLKVQYFPRPADLEQRIQDFVQSLVSFDPQLPTTDEVNAKHIQVYASHATALYELLLSPVSKAIGYRLKIVPDGVLNLLPFGALLEEKPADPNALKTYRFLDQTRVISYNYSATLYQTMQNQKVHRSKMLAVAPSFQASTKTEERDFGPLAFNQLEASQVLEIFPGKLVAGATANKDAIMKQAGRFGMLHFATHARVDDENADRSCLAFYGGDRLFLQELYDLKLPAQLVTLSACQTNVGPLQTGEGLASLARGFSYAGAKSIVTSLWDVQDKAATDIMQDFYLSLAKGASKDQALHQAKVDYLKKSSGNMLHPYFWATFILIGSEAPISTPSLPLKAQLILLFGSMLAIYIFIKRRKNGQHARDEPTNYTSGC